MVRRLFFLVALVLLLGSAWWNLNVQRIGAGVAIFLFGMLSLDNGFRVFTGGTLERLLQRSTDRIWKSIGFGIVTTSLVQSSSLVSVITISFLSSGLMGLLQGIGVIFGANIGTTTGAWLVSAIGLKVSLSVYAMPMLMTGVVLIMQSNQHWRGLGHVLTGLGFLFLGIDYMKEGFSAFQSVLDLRQFALAGILGLLVYTLAGLLATVIMQSSHATLILTITALASDQITYDNAIALAIGANIGTTVTAIIGAIGAASPGRQLAAAHFVFNSVTALVALLFHQPMIHLVDWLSTVLGIAADNYTLKLSLFHTIFNVTGVLLMLPFMRRLAEQLKRWFTDERQSRLSLPARQTDRRQDPVTPRYLTSSVMTHPDVALSALLQETRRLWDNSVAVMAYALFLDRDDIESEQPLDLLLLHSAVHEQTSDIDELYERYVRPLNTAIVTASHHLPGQLTDAQQETVFALKVACRDLVNAVKDVKHLQKNLRRYHNHPSEELNQQYRAFRLQLAELLHRLQSILNYPDEEEALLGFSEQHQWVKKQDILKNGTFDRLVASGSIPAEAITSLMNDSEYCRNIGFRLIHMAQKLYWAQTGSAVSALQSLILEDEELQENSDVTASE